MVNAVVLFTLVHRHARLVDSSLPLKPITLDINTKMEIRFILFPSTIEIKEEDTNKVALQNRNRDRRESVS